MSPPHAVEGARSPPAKRRPGRRLGLVWAAPAGALLVVAWLLLQAVINPTIHVEVTFGTAAGVMPGQTRVAYRGLDEGLVQKAALAPDGRRIRMILALKPDARPLLREGSRFWIVGAKPSLADPNSLKSVFTGSSIEMSPGTGPAARRFVGEDQAPPIAPGTPGRRFVLEAADIGDLHPDASVYLHGLEVGKVLDTALTGDGRVRVAVFVRAPYDREVREQSRFWLADPVQVSQGVEGLVGRLGSAQALLLGGVVFDTPPQARATPAAEDGRQFVLYAGEGDARVAPIGPEVGYTLRFAGDVGRLEVGAPVRLKGFVVGRVTDVALAVDDRAGAVSAPVTIALQPMRLHLAGEPVAGARADEGWTAALDAALGPLIRRGLTASIAQDPPLIGAREVRLDLAKGAAGAPIRYAEGRLVIPTAAPPDLEAVLRDAGQVVATVKNAPIGEIAENTRQVAARLRRLTASPELQDSLDHLDGALRNADAIAREARPQVGPLAASLRRAADQVQSTAAAAQALVSGEGAAQDSDLPSAVRQLTEAARAIRGLADDLDRRPEALIRGKRPAH